VHAWIEGIAEHPRVAGILSFLSRLIPASFFGVVCVAFWMDYRQTGRLTSLAWIASEGLVVVLYVIRRRSDQVSTNPLDWLVAIGGSLIFLMVRPADYALVPQAVALALQMTGLVVQVAGKVTLGRSFGAVAANRGVVTGGPYRLVRHPIYLGYLLTHIGFLLADVSLRNIMVYSVGYCFQIARIVAEERMLRRDHEYCRYCEQVHYRLIPGVF
jgi:protein-S-isoprenylcysteine O-methyltransferase Ste14